MPPLELDSKDELRLSGKLLLESTHWIWKTTTSGLAIRWQKVIAMAMSKAIYGPIEQILTQWKSGHGHVHGHGHSYDYNHAMYPDHDDEVE